MGPVRRVLPLGFLLAACSSNPVEVRDEQVFQPGGRLLVKFDEPEVGKPWFGIALDVTEINGDDSQQLEAGEQVELDGTLFTGPTTLDVEYELQQQSLALAFGLEVPEQHLDSYLELGLGRILSELKLRAGATRAKESENFDGLHLAGGLLWDPTVVLGLEGRAALIVDLDDIGSTWETLELGTRLFPRSPVALFAGWRWIEVYHDHDQSSDLDLRASGPALALRVTL